MHYDKSDYMMVRLILRRCNEFCGVGHEFCDVRAKTCDVAMKLARCWFFSKLMRKPQTLLLFYFILQSEQHSVHLHPLIIWSWRLDPYLACSNYFTLVLGFIPGWCILRSYPIFMFSELSHSLGSIIPESVHIVYIHFLAAFLVRHDSSSGYVSIRSIVCMTGESISSVNIFKEVCLKMNGWWSCCVSWHPDGLIELGIP
jgi:hypothetical protein